MLETENPTKANHRGTIAKTTAHVEITYLIFYFDIFFSKDETKQKTYTNFTSF